MNEQKKNVYRNLSLDAIKAPNKVKPTVKSITTKGDDLRAKGGRR